MTMTKGPHTETGFVEINGAPLYYEVSGAGRALVLLHEGFTDSRMFDDQMTAFASQYRVVRYDRHGHGRSGTPAGPYTHHGALRDLLRHLGIERAAVLGMSAGGGVALDFTLAYPELVEALIPVAASINGYAASDETLRGWGQIGAALQAGDVPGAVELTLRMWVDGPRRDPSQVDARVRERMREMIVHYYTIRGDDPPALEPPAIGRLAEIRVPSLVIAGEGDVPDILAQAELLCTTIPGARKALIPEVAHVPNLERPEQFNRLVLDFLAARPD